MPKIKDHMLTNPLKPNQLCEPGFLFLFLLNYCQTPA